MAAQAQATTGRKRKGKGLSRQVVAAAAIQLVEAEGIEALTMRRVASVLGVEAMSLYGHVANKHDLMVAMNDTIMAGVGASSESDDPLDDAIRFARELRAALLRYPNTARLFAMNMTLQDSYATQVLTAKSLELLGRLGHDVQSGAYTFGLCLSFVIGAVLLEIAMLNSATPTDIYDPAVAFDRGILLLLQGSNQPRRQP